MCVFVQIGRRRDLNFTSLVFVLPLTRTQNMETSTPNTLQSYSSKYALPTRRETSRSLWASPKHCPKSGKNPYYLNMRTKCTIIPRAQVISAIRFWPKYNTVQSNNTKINEIILPSLRHRKWIDSWWRLCMQCVITYRLLCSNFSTTHKHTHTLTWNKEREIEIKN